MARRRKSTEVLITGDKVDPRARFQTDTGPVAKPPSAEIKPPADDTKADSPLEALGMDSAGRRLRKKPKVIDARDTGPAPQAQSWDTDSGGDGQAGEGAAWENDAAGARKPGEGANWEEDPSGRKLGDDAEWEENARGKKTDEDANWEENARGRKSGDDAAWEENARGKKADDDAAWAEDQRQKAPAPAELTEAPKPEPPKPKAAPPKAAPPKTGGRTPTAKEQSAVLASTVVNSMVSTMRAEAARKGSLSVADIDAMQNEFAKQAAALTQTFETSFEAYVEARERANWDQKRDYPFDRVIVKKFSALFKEEDMSRFDRVSRRMLPGFFLALGMMLGHEAVDDYQEKSRLIVSRVRDKRGDAFDWEDVYSDQDAGALVMDALVSIGNHFIDFERRSEWFMEIINGHLAPTEDSDKADSGWELGPAGVKLFLKTLLADLRRALASRDGQIQLSKRHGAETVKALIRLFKVIEAKPQEAAG